MVYGGPVPKISSGLQPQDTRVEPESGLQPQDTRVEPESSLQPQDTRVEPEVVGDAEMLNIATSLVEELIEQTICDESSDLAAMIFEVLLWA